ncbi:MAG: sulfatase-like hydrolase/transferase [Verrucomicrobia bacterium]|nr:sulfatase-like hydrolase/transferase [Verrucomicrobiota bacterium]MBT6237849.1 sulfatase-like hydrolase/transferase [Verrucomicrobiota bacterium]MBT7536352.1 sulfatase-like hydrolase/transferase [Verrucomicrobiota bacterium]
MHKPLFAIFSLVIRYLRSRVHGSEERSGHILLIMAADIGIEGFGCYGGEDCNTPNIDQLTSKGLRFTNAYAHPLCTPTRLEIMTGRENHRN